MQQLGAVDAKLSLCFMVLVMRAMICWHMFSDIIMSFNRYVNAGIKTWLWMYLNCLSVIAFLLMIF
jgi:hypothetical protein